MYLYSSTIIGDRWLTTSINCCYIYYRYRLITLIEDDTGNMDVTIFDRAAQALIKKPCSTLTINEGFTHPFTIPPPIAQLREQMKIFRVYFQQRGAHMTAIVLKIFEDTLPTTPLPQISAAAAPSTK